MDVSGNVTVEPNVVYLAVAPEDIEHDEQIELIEPEEVKPIADAQKVKSKCTRALPFYVLLVRSLRMLTK